jgi:alpha-mannosidase
VVVEAVKRAENSDDVIVRLYEAASQTVSTAIQFGFAIERAAEVNLVERELGNLAIADDRVEVSLRPFEIKTLRVTPSGEEDTGFR